MFAICSVSPNVNGVRKHVRIMKENGQFFRVVQTPTKNYRRLHKMSVNCGAQQVMEEVNAMENTHKIDIDGLIIHTPDCIHVEDGFVDASIKDMSTVGLSECSYCLGK